MSCPWCSWQNWQLLDNDLWRMEKWLQFAEETQSSQTVLPTNIEQLEDVIQDHREFFMDVDSHKKFVVSLNIVGAHLADHAENVQRAEGLRARLVRINSRWEAVCRAAAARQTQLQTALMENYEFHNLIDELVAWLEKTEGIIRQTDPVDPAGDIEEVEAKYNKFHKLRNEIERCEPRVTSLQEAADQLIRHSAAPERATCIWTHLTELRFKLQSLRSLTGVYILKLEAVLGQDPSKIGVSVATDTSGCSTAATSLMCLSQELLDQGASGHVEGSVYSEQQHKNDDASSEQDILDTSVLAQGYYFLGRVLRTSLPMQTVILQLHGVATLVPIGEWDYSCIHSSTFTHAFEPMLFYPNGPPST